MKTRRLWSAYTGLLSMIKILSTLEGAMKMRRLGPEEFLGTPRNSMALESVVIGELFLLSFLPLKKPSHRTFFVCSTSYSTFRTDVGPAQVNLWADNAATISRLTLYFCTSILVSPLASRNVRHLLFTSVSLI
jgi:hypothetical protein